MKVILVSLLTMAIIVNATSQSFDINNVYPIETDHSFIEFEITYFGYAKVKGSFSDFYGSIYFDKTNPSKTSITFQINVESIDTNNDWRDQDLKSKNWFLEEQFPHIKFTSTSARVNENELIVKGDLTIKETTKNISLNLPMPIVVDQDIRGDRQVIFTGSYTLNRKEYGVMGKNWSEVKEGIAALSDDVAIEFSLLGKQTKEDNFKNFLRSERTPHGAIYAAYKADGLDAAKMKFEDLQKDQDLGSSALNMVVYMLLAQGKKEDALDLMKINQKAFPEDPDVYDMMGEVYAHIGNLKEAKKSYQKTLELDAQNTNAAEILKHLN